MRRSLVCLPVIAFTLFSLQAPPLPAQDRPANGKAEALDPSYPIHLRQGSFTPDPADLEASLAALALRGADLARRGEPMLHALLQFQNELTAEEQSALAATGVVLGDSIPENAWIAAVPSDRVAATLGRAGLRWASAWDAPRKLDPEIARGTFTRAARHPSRPGQVKLFVQLHAEIPLTRLETFAASLGGVALEPVAGLQGGTIWIPDDRLAALTASEDVLWVSEAASPLQPLNDGVLAATRGGWVQTALGLDGAGTRIFIYDAGTVEEEHPTFEDGAGSRVTALDDTPIHDHATHVAGTAAGDGSDDPLGGQKGRGMAPAAQIFSAGVEFQIGPFTHEFADNLGDLQKDYAKGLGEHNADVVNNSIGLEVAADFELSCAYQGDYSLYAQLVDSIARGDQPGLKRTAIVVWAAGNERGAAGCGTTYETMAPPSCLKNAITVGATHSDGGAMTEFSSWGPCDDGRLAPTIVAPGDESGLVTGDLGIYSSIVGGTYHPLRGTSMAAPAVTGAIAQLIQDWRKRGHGDADEQPRPSLVRALVVHSAHDIGPEGPDYTYGYGALDAARLIALERGDDGKLGNGNGPQWGTDSLDKAKDERIYTILLGADLPRLQATLAWDDPAANQLATPALVNDLTLELISPSNQVVQAWRLDPLHPELPAVLAGNNLDNLEQVVVEEPEQGLWKVRVRAAKLPTGPQPFALVYASTPQTYTHCYGQTWSFETPAPPAWTFSGSSIETFPTGSANHAVEVPQGATASFTLQLPSDLARADLRFRIAPSTEEVQSNHDFRDLLNVELRDATTHKVPALLDRRDSSWPNEVWLEAQNLDLRSGKIEIAFVADDDGDDLKSTFYVDDVEATWCPKESVEPHFDLESKGNGQDGYIVESSADSSVGGAIYKATHPKDLVGMGDWLNDSQVKGIFSFDTSDLPDDLVINGAVLELRLQQISGGNPHHDLELCQVDIATGFFGDSPELEAKDFEAPATHPNVSPLGYASAPLETSYANLAYHPWNQINPPVNKTGLTQARIYCKLEDDDDQTSDLAHYFSGAAPKGLRPVLVVEYNP